MTTDYFLSAGGVGFGVIGTRLVGAGGFFGVLEGVKDPLTGPTPEGRRAPLPLLLISRNPSVAEMDSLALAC